MFCQTRGRVKNYRLKSVSYKYDICYVFLNFVWSVLEACYSELKSMKYSDMDSILIVKTNEISQNNMKWTLGDAFAILVCTTMFACWY